MGKYYINYHTGAGNGWYEGTLDEVKAIADDEACYTQQSIAIEDENGNPVSIRGWCGIEYDPETDEEDEDEVIQFGSFGHYGAWHDL